MSPKTRTSQAHSERTSPKDFPVNEVASLKNQISYDSIIIGDIDNCYELAKKLSELSISDEKYQVCTGQRIKAVTVVQVVE